MQVEEMKRAAGRGVKLAFKDEERELALKARGPQVPRVFYRRELEGQQLVVAKTVPNLR
jgi:hypothetical protein